MNFTSLRLLLFLLLPCGCHRPAPLPPPPGADDLAFHARIEARGEDQFREILDTSLHRFVPGGEVFPLAEPSSNAKRPRDFTPFQAALDDFPPERLRELDELLPGATIAALRNHLVNGRLSAVELTLWSIEQIRCHDIDRLNAVLELNPDALDIAARRDEELAAGRGNGALHGIPILLKDNIATGDRMHLTAGAFALKDWRADRDAALVTRLRDAGAVILGKTNLSEWANYMDPALPNGFSTLGGQTRSPYGPFDPSGSSSGSAVAVAAGFAVAAIGTETSGSIIQPARFNSLVGLRPSLGSISRDHIIPLSSTLDTPGPMARSVEDVALLFAVLAGQDLRRSLSLKQARRVRVGVLLLDERIPRRLEQAKALLRFTGRDVTGSEDEALLRDHVIPELGGDPEVALAALRSQGIPVVEIRDETLPPSRDTVGELLAYDFRESLAAFFAGMGGDAPVTGLEDIIGINRGDPANRMPYGQRYLEWAAGTDMTAAEFERYRDIVRAMAARWMGSILATHRVDVLVSGMTYTSNAGAAGIPALTIPAGLDASGRPQGIILTGPHGSEANLFAVGHALELHLNGRVEPDLERTIREIDAVSSGHLENGN